MPRPHHHHPLAMVLNLVLINLLPTPIACILLGTLTHRVVRIYQHLGCAYTDWVGWK